MAKSKNSLRVYPRQSQNPLQRLAEALGEISVLRNYRPSGWGFKYSTPYRLDSSKVDYSLARELYRNINDKYKLGAGFAKPIINTTAGFMGAPSFTHQNKVAEADKALEEHMDRWTGKILRTNRNMLRDGDVYARIIQQPSRFNLKEESFDLTLVPPEWVTPIPDPITGSLMEVAISYPIRKLDKDGREEFTYTLIERITAKTREFEFDGKAPQEAKDRYQKDAGANPWGFIPIVHFRNEAEEHQVYGCSELESVEPFMKAYHDTMLHAVQGSRMFSRPKASFALKSVDKFLRDNFSADEIRSKKLKFADKEIYLMQEGDKAGFITAESGSAGITTLLEFIFYCIVDVSETPEFAFGTAVASSKASVSEQMTPLAKKIQRKRGMAEEPYGELASMFLAMWSQVENVKLETYQVDTEWEELSPKDDKEVADTIKTLVDGLVTAVEGNLLSVPAAADFLREFVPTALPFEDEEEDDDEQRRIVKYAAWQERLRDGEGWERGEGDELDPNFDPNKDPNKKPPGAGDK